MPAPFKTLAPQDVLEAYYANVQRSETIHMVMLDTDGLVVATNRATARLFGKTPDELNGRSWFELAISDAKRDAVRTVFLRLLATGLPEVEQTEITVADGTTRTMLWSNSLMRAGDRLTGVVSFGIDVTEQAKAHEQLKLERQLLQRAEEIAGLGTYVLDVQTGVWTSSAVLDRIFGITDIYPRTVQSWLDLVHPDDREQMADYFNSHVLMQHQAFDRTYRTVRKSDNATRVVHGYGELDIDADGKVVRMLGTIQDITDQAHVSADLLESEARFRELVQHSPDAIVILDGETARFIEANPRAEELFGMARREILEIGPVEVSPPNQPDGRPSSVAAREYIQQCVRGEEPVFEWMHRTKQGVEKLCLIRLLKLPSHGRTLIRGSMTDISLEHASRLKMEESEQRYRTLVELSPDAIGIHRDGKFLYANAAGLRMMGLKDVKEIIGKSVFDFEAPEIRTESAQRIKQVSQGNASTTVETQFLRADGSRYDVDVRSVPITYQGLPAILSIVRDITERKKTERKLALSEERFRLVAESTGQLVYDWDIEANTTTQWEGAIESITGYTPDEYKSLSNEQWYDHIHPEDRPHVMKILDEARTSGATYHYEYRLRRKDGSYTNVEDSGVFVRNAENASIRMVGTIKDVTQRIKADQLIRESSKRMHSILDKSPDDIVIITPDGTCTYANNSKMFGYTPEEMVGTNQFRLIHPEDAPVVSATIRELIAQPLKSLKANFRVHHKNGSWRSVEAVGINLLDDPAVAGLLIFSRDITDIQKGQAAMVRIDELEAMNKAMVGRELRIAELKDEIARLKSQLESSAR